jgi:hypothetical protein
VRARVRKVARQAPSARTGPKVRRRVCAENLVRVDLVTESHNHRCDGCAAISIPPSVGFVFQVGQPSRSRARRRRPRGAARSISPFKAACGDSALSRGLICRFDFSSTGAGMVGNSSSCAINLLCCSELAHVVPVFAPLTVCSGFCYRTCGWISGET